MKKLIFIISILFCSCLFSQEKNKYIKDLINNLDSIKLPYSTTYSKEKSLFIKDLEKHILISTYNTPPTTKYKDPKKELSFYLVGKIRIDSGFNVILLKIKSPSCAYFLYEILLFDLNYNCVGSKQINSCVFKNDYPNFYITQDKFLFDFSIKEVIDLNNPLKSIDLIYNFKNLKFCAE